MFIVLDSDKKAKAFYPYFNSIPQTIYEMVEKETVVWTAEIKDFATVEKYAKQLTEVIGKKIIAIDRDRVYPRFTIMEMYEIGDPVSYAFNGDYYPDGHIVKISPSLMITTSTGKKYRRYKTTGTWLQPGGTWRLIDGHHDDKNMSF